MFIVTESVKYKFPIIFRRHYYPVVSCSQPQTMLAILKESIDIPAERDIPVLQQFACGIHITHIITLFVIHLQPILFRSNPQAFFRIDKNTPYLLFGQSMDVIIITIGEVNFIKTVFTAYPQIFVGISQKSSPFCPVRLFLSGCISIGRFQSVSNRIIRIKTPATGHKPNSSELILMHMPESIRAGQIHLERGYFPVGRSIT